MTFVLTLHDVDDYERWKSVFDDAADLRFAAGESDYQVSRHTDDAGRIVHLSRWTSEASARAFFESQRLVEIRAEAGVYAPTFPYLELTSPYPASR